MNKWLDEFIQNHLRGASAILLGCGVVLGIVSAALTLPDWCVVVSIISIIVGFLGILLD